MAKVKILYPGYSSTDSGGHSCSSVVLVQDKNLNMVADPGTVPDPKILVENLKKEGLKPEDINVVYLTHSHLDHFRCLGLFPRAKVLDFFGWWQSDVCTDYEGQVTADIAMIETPGHSADGTTLLVKTDEGKVAICGDVFWKENYPADDPYAVNKDQLVESRKKVLAAADFVIPGHGPMFRSKN